MVGGAVAIEDPNRNEWTEEDDLFSSEFAGLSDQQQQDLLAQKKQDRLSHPDVKPRSNGDFHHGGTKSPGTDPLQQFLDDPHKDWDKDNSSDV